MNKYIFSDSNNIVRGTINIPTIEEVIVTINMKQKVKQRYLAINCKTTLLSEIMHLVKWLLTYLVSIYNVKTVPH